jgi:hypothetical protein
VFLDLNWIGNIVLGQQQALDDRLNNQPRHISSVQNTAQIVVQAMLEGNLLQEGIQAYAISVGYRQLENPRFINRNCDSNGVLLGGYSQES